MITKQKARITNNGVLCEICQAALCNLVILEDRLHPRGTMAFYLLNVWSAIRTQTRTSEI